MPVFAPARCLPAVFLLVFAGPVLAQAPQEEAAAPASPEKPVSTEPPGLRPVEPTDSASDPAVAAPQETSSAAPAAESTPEAAAQARVDDPTPGAASSAPVAPAPRAAPPAPVVPFGTPHQVVSPSPEPAAVAPAEAVPAAHVSSAPLLHYAGPAGITVQLTGNLRASAAMLQPFASDRDGTALSPTPVETRVRLAPAVRYARFGVIGEADLVTGAMAGLPEEDLRLGPSAHPTMTPAELRQLYVEYRGDTFAVRAGQQTSQWGLGLVANNGADEAAPGEFGDAHYGDLTWRALLAGRPLYGLGGAFRAIEPILAVDMIVRDDTADYSQGDRALQGVAAMRFNVDEHRNLGVYAVYRQQRADGVTDGGRSTDAFIVDVAGQWRWVNERRDAETKLGFEAALIRGTTTLIRSDTAPVLDLRQLGAAVKGSMRVESWEGYLDLGFASGDQNPYDATLDSFRFDPDYRAGLILFQELMAWQSARTYTRAIDPEVTGYPQEGVDLLPTRGAITGAAYAFPRVRKGVREWLDVYGGPLVAISTASMVDAFNTRIAGGTPRNALGGVPGRYLGTELDLGVQARLTPIDGMALTATAEAGYLVPGSAFALADGRTLGPIAAARVRVGARF